MTRELQPGRQPLLWAALFFSSGIWIGVRAWRPALWWVIAAVAFGLAAVWFIRERSWFAKGLALGAWFLLGALLVQVRGALAVDPRIAELADGSVVTVTGHVIREGYVRASGPRSVRHPVDIETESIEGVGPSEDIKCGVRLTIAEVVERLQNDGVKTYRTDMTGAVSFYLDGKTVTPEVAIIR